MVGVFPLSRLYWFRYDDNIFSTSRCVCRSRSWAGLPLFGPRETDVLMLVMNNSCARVVSWGCQKNNNNKNSSRVFVAACVAHGFLAKAAVASRHSHIQTALGDWLGGNLSKGEGGRRHCSECLVTGLSSYILLFVAFNSCAARW